MRSGESVLFVLVSDAIKSYIGGMFPDLDETEQDEMYERAIDAFIDATEREGGSWGPCGECGEDDRTHTMSRILGDVRLHCDTVDDRKGGSA